MKITSTGSNADLDVKRCYLPITITDTCPQCGATVERDLGDHYLSYPAINRPFEITMYHDHEDVEEHSWKVRVILRVTMEAA